MHIYCIITIIIIIALHQHRIYAYGEFTQCFLRHFVHSVTRLVRLKLVLRADAITTYNVCPYAASIHGLTTRCVSERMRQRRQRGVVMPLNAAYAQHMSAFVRRAANEEAQRTIQKLCQDESTTLNVFGWRPVAAATLDGWWCGRGEALLTLW